MPIFGDLLQRDLLQHDLLQRSKTDFVGAVKTLVLTVIFSLS